MIVETFSNSTAGPPSASRRVWISVISSTGLTAAPTRAEAVAAFAAAIEAVKARGKAKAGDKTMLDVLIPVQAAAADGADTATLRRVAAQAAEATVGMQARRGRASFLGERSVGHMDPGARSSQLMVEAVCDVLENA